MGETRYAFVLSEWHRYAGWSSTRKVVETSGSVDELRQRLRPWALAVITADQLSDGEYFASLVEARDGCFEAGLTLSCADVFWFYGEEFVPASASSA
jgi:hypothetical protein